MDTQKAAVSPRQLKILKMDTLRLNQYLNDMMMENPVIEIEENLTGYTDEDMRARKAEWLESNDFEEGLGYFDKDAQLPQDEDTDYAMLNVGEEETLEQHLLTQLAVQQLPERIRSAAEYLVGCLDENGYLLAQAEDLIAQGYCESEYDEALAVIRNLEPLGVGASSLRECLYLQLDEDDEIAHRLLEEIDLTGSADVQQMSEQFGYQTEQIEQAMNRIRMLNPKPGSQYTSHDRSPYILPDVVMIKFADEFYVALSDFSFPQIKINEDYENLLRRSQGPEQQEAREYLTEKIADAHALQEEVAFRGRTLVEVTKALIKLQEAFFRYGPRYMKLLPVQELADALGLDFVPRRIEGYDISNTQGTLSVASMVVAIDGQPARSQYRHYRIKTVIGANDFASMAEVIHRRFTRGERERLEAVKNGVVPDGFADLPDLVLIDGGPEQLRFAQESIHEVPMEKYPAMFGLAKRLEEIYLPDRDDPIRLDEHSEALRLIQRVRDEAHRFAITHHRGLRTRRSVASRLEEIPGIGATRRRALLTHYANLDAMKQATLDELRDVPGMNQPAAEAVYAFFHAEEGGSQRG